MFTIRTPNPNFTGTRHGVTFTDGVAVVGELAAHVRAFFAEQGYGIDGPPSPQPKTSEPVQATPSEQVANERAGRRRAAR